MAGAVRTGGRSRNQYRSAGNARTYAYVDGTAVRRLEAAPVQRTAARRPEPAPEQRMRERQTRPASQTARKNRERALSMNLGYVMFLTLAAVITVFTCVNFLQLQAKGTKLQKEVTALETRLDAAVLENDSDYNRIMTSVDMEKVKDIALNQLGMVYAKKSQIVTYEMQNSDYVRQYSEIPSE